MAPEIKSWYYYWLILKDDTGFTDWPTPKILYWACQWAGLNVYSPAKMKEMFRSLGFDPDVELGIVHLDTTIPQPIRPSFRKKK